MREVYQEHIYSLEERHESDISPLWQGLQVLFYLCCIIFGFVVFYCFSNVLVVTQQNCILYSKVVFHENYSNQQLDEKVLKNTKRNIKTVYSDLYSHYCDHVVYIPVIITIFSSFFMVLFAICGRGGAGSQKLPDAWRIVMPAIFFNLTCFCLTMYTASIFHGGLKAFIQNLAEASGEKKLELKDLRDLHLDHYHIGTSLFRYLVLTKHAMWMMVSFWGLNFFWIFLRCIFIVDFQLVRTTVNMHPKSSTVQTSDEQREDDHLEEVLSSEAHPGNELQLTKPTGSSMRFRNVHFSPSTVQITEPTPALLTDACTSMSSSFVAAALSSETLPSQRS